MINTYLENIGKELRDQSEEALRLLLLEVGIKTTNPKRFHKRLKKKGLHIISDLTLQDQGSSNMILKILKDDEVIASKTIRIQLTQDNEFWSTEITIY